MPNGSCARTASEFAAAAGSGLLLAGAHPPFGFAWAALVGPIPLLWAWRRCGPARGALYGAVAGVVFFGLLITWIIKLGAVAYVPFVLVLSAWWAAMGAVAGLLNRRGVNGAVSMAALWVLVEAARARVPFGGFSWGEVGYAFHDVPSVRALAGWGGVGLISFVIVLSAGVLLGLADPRRRQRTAAALATVALFVAGASAALPEPSRAGTLSVALVQGNDLDRDLTPSEAAARYLSDNHLRLAAGIAGPVDLVVLPESSLEADPRQDEELDADLTALAARLDATVLAGGTTEDGPGGRLYNTTFLYTPGGRSPLKYRKRHLVPFGEFVPWRDALSFISALDQVPRDYAPGPSATVFPAGETGVGALICFDSAFSTLARDYVRPDVGAIVVSTNNRSYGSSNSEQHVAISQLRAVETGRPVLHAGIAGISAVVSAEGEVQGKTEMFDPTVLQAEVATATGTTPYARTGDGPLLLFAAGALAVAATRRGRGSERDGP